MKKIIEHNGHKVHQYLCNKCKQEVLSLMCRIIDITKPDTPENWIELCGSCFQEEEMNRKADFITGLSNILKREVKGNGN